MPYFSIDHLREAVSYLASRRTHPTLLTLLAMLRKGIPTSDDQGDAKPFGSPDELRLMDDYFRPPGGPEERPFFLVLGPGYGYSRWRDREYAGRTLWTQRSKKNHLFRQSAENNRRWTLASDLADGIAGTPAEEVVGTLPLGAAYLAVWCYRSAEFESVAAAVDRFVTEFHLNDYGLVPDVFTTDLPGSLEALPLSDQPVDHGTLLEFLQTLQPQVEQGDDQAAPPGEDEGGAQAPQDEAAGPDRRPAVDGSDARVLKPREALGDWGITVDDLGDLAGLKGLEESALLTLAALSSGFNVILTGPPGSGKTTLAECICSKAGFPSRTVPATDQWTTFETIGGYFPVPGEGVDKDRLDFLSGAVVDALEKGRCLIVDEINRADIDKAFGEMFTLLGGTSVTLPYRRRSPGGRFRTIKLQVGAGVVEGDDLDVVVVPPWWRIIGSMNDADKASLKRLSTAFMRRFAFVPVGLPREEAYRDLIRPAIGKTEAGRNGQQGMARIGEDLIHLFTSPDRGFGGIGFPLGPAFPLAVIRHADGEWRLDPNRSSEKVLANSLELHVVPQMQGRDDLHPEVVEMLRPALKESTSAFERNLAVWTGYIAS